MTNTNTMPNQTVKDFPIPRLIDDSSKTEEEIIAELDLALEQVKNGECISSKDFKAMFSEKYGINF